MSNFITLPAFSILPLLFQHLTPLKLNSLVRFFTIWENTFFLSSPFGALRDSIDWLVSGEPRQQKKGSPTSNFPEKSLLSMKRKKKVDFFCSPFYGGCSVARRKMQKIHSSHSMLCCVGFCQIAPPSSLLLKRGHEGP